jgi:hypothetical protein
LSERSVALTRDPELLGKAADSSASLPAFFPCESHLSKEKKPLPPDSVLLCLKPGQSAQVSWKVQSIAVELKDSAEKLDRSGRVTTRNDSAEKPDIPEWFPEIQEWVKERIVNPIRNHIRNEMQFFFFTPGNYKVAAVAKYWTSPKQPRYDYRIATQSIMVTVAVPQFVILLGAALGGLIAFLIFPPTRTQKLTQNDTKDNKVEVSQDTRISIPVHRKVGQAFGAMLLSAIVTILLSRLADTPFLIKVSVADFWGAIVTGMVAQYLGFKWLEHLLPAAKSASNSEDPAKAKDKEESKSGKQTPPSNNHSPSPQSSGAAVGV